VCGRCKSTRRRCAGKGGPASGGFQGVLPPGRLGTMTADPAEPGGAPGPAQVKGTVLTVRRVDAYHAMTVIAPGVAARFRPGQFVAVAVGGPETSMLLRRAFSIHQVRPDHGGTVEFVFAVTGPGTRWLSERRTRDTLDVAGPLGRPFPVPRDPVNALLVGGGYGSAPLFALGDRLRGRGCAVDYLLGAASVDRVFGALTARRSGRSAVIATEDGSLGARGKVTDLLAQVIHEARTDVIYACGPMGMLRTVTALARRYDIPVQALVEESMACGTGVCMTCVLPVVGEDGVTRMTRSCVDGPVFRGDLVRWDDVGTVPFEALGAPGWKPRPQAKPQPQPQPQPPARPQGGGGRQPGRRAAGRGQPGRRRSGPAAGRSGHGR